jgi:hypothetical protein
MVNNSLGMWEGEAPTEPLDDGSAGASPSRNGGTQHALDHYKFLKEGFVIEEPARLKRDH